MILTQYVIDMWKYGKFDTKEFMNEKFPGNQLCFLYPHPISTGKKLYDFNFKRGDFLKFLRYLRERDPHTYRSFVLSTKNSSIFKMTGYKYRNNPDVTQ